MGDNRDNGGAALDDPRFLLAKRAGWRAADGLAGPMMLSRAAMVFGKMFHIELDG
jgi:hypothetical protein